MLVSIDVPKKQKNRKMSLLTILGFTLALTVCVFSILTFLSKKSFSIAGYSCFLVSSSSMEPAYPLHTFVITKNQPYNSLNTGDVIVFKSDALNGGLAFHRISRTTDEGFYTKGDNNEYEDNQPVTEKNYVSKSVAQFNNLGLYLFVIRNPSGFILYLLLPVFAISLFCLSIKKLLFK